MSLNERTGERNLAFSRWHRTLPAYCSACDLDLYEVHSQCNEPLALFETAQGHHGRPKSTRFLEGLARRADLPAYLVLYDAEDEEIGDEVRVRRVHPSPTPLRTYSLEQLERLVVRIHCEHRCAA